MWIVSQFIILLAMVSQTAQRLGLCVWRFIWGVIKYTWHFICAFSDQIYADAYIAQSYIRTRMKRKRNLSTPKPIHLHVLDKEAYVWIGHTIAYLQKTQADNTFTLKAALLEQDKHTLISNLNLILKKS